jgi:archaellum component FlaC
MATKKTNQSASIRSSLIAGAGMAADKFTGLKDFKVNVGGLLGMMQKEAAETEKIKQQLNSQLEYMPDVTKVAENEAPMLQDYFQTGKNQIADLHNELQYADPEGKRQIQQQISQIQNSAKAANGYLSKKVELAQEFRDNLDNISNSMPKDKLEKIQAVLMGNDYKLEFNDYSGKPVYVLPDGSRVEHEELDDFYYKDSKTALTINDYSETYINKGRQNEPLTKADVNILKTKLGQSITDEGSLNSLISDNLIEGMNFGAAIQELGPNATFQEKKEKVVDYITERLQDVHGQGQKEYNSKQNVNDTGITKPVDGSIPFISTRNQGDFIWYEEFGGYGPGLPNPAGGVMKNKNLTKDQIVSDPDALNTMAVGLGDIKFGK